MGKKKQPIKFRGKTIKLVEATSDPSHGDIGKMKTFWSVECETGVAYLVEKDSSTKKIKEGDLVLIGQYKEGGIFRAVAKVHVEFDFNADKKTVNIQAIGKNVPSLSAVGAASAMRLIRDLADRTYENANETFHQVPQYLY